MSLQEQLKKSGLVDEKKAKQLKRAKLKEDKLVRKNQVSSSEELQLALQRKKQLQLEKAAQVNKDKLLNQEKHAAAQNIALKAQINQLVESNRVKPDGDKKYGYVDAGKIKNLWVNQLQLDQLSRGVLCIVSHASGATMVPRVIADKIEQRNSAVVLHKTETKVASLDDDPYAKYEIPDDLDW
jgi:hypothetical protein